jgi:hypothetical protein
MLQRELERLAGRVRAAARGDGLIETAQVKLVGLDDVRIAAGARWPRMREHVREGSLRIISQRIGADDAVIPCGDGFLVVFADASSEETKARCAEIHDALIGFYLGEEALRDLRANVERETVSAKHLAQFMSAETPHAHTPPRRTQLQPGRFWPVWSARHLAVATYLCAPAITSAEAMRHGYSAGFLEKAAHEERDYLDLDLCLLEQACTAAEAGAAPIGLTVHVTTLQARKSRMIYLEHLAANASPAHQRMFVTIAEIEPGAPLMSLTEWTTALKQYVPRVALELHHTDRAIGALASTGAWAAGYHLPAARVNSSTEVRTSLNELDGWCRALRRQGLMSFISGFQDAAFLDLAGYSDLGFASGEKLWPSQAQPGPLMAATRTRTNAAIVQAAAA